MQVLTACLKSFAHGANDTANAAGPFAAVQSLYLDTDTGCQGIGTPLWVLAFCGVGIVVVRSCHSYCGLQNGLWARQSHVWQLSNTFTCGSHLLRLLLLGRHGFMHSSANVKLRK